MRSRFEGNCKVYLEPSQPKKVDQKQNFCESSRKKSASELLNVRMTCSENKGG